MSKILFEDEGTYSLTEYNRSHSQLLLRKRVNDNGYHNIDIIFKSVQYISIPVVLKGIEIAVVEDHVEVALLMKAFNLVSLNHDYVLYCLKNSNREKFYLYSGVFGVFKNKLDILESSLGDFTWSDRNELVYWSGK